ncbi:GyrI-like domain-containing protein [Chloroflexota bacterium]
MQEFKLKDIPQRKICYLACKGPWRQLPEMLARLSEYTAQDAVRTIGPPGAFYYNMPQEVDVQDLAWEVFYPIKLDTPESISEKTGLGVRVIEGVRVATTIHEGSYQKAASSYKRLHDWIRMQGLKTCGAAEEVYLTNISKIEKDQRIEICLPICAV